MSDRQFYMWMVLAMLFWGASWPIAKVLSNYMSLHEFIAYRYLVVVLSMALVLRWLKLSFKIDWANLLIATGAAVLLIFYTKYYFLSTKHGEPGLAGAVVTTLMPILVYVLSLFTRQKRPEAKHWAALALGGAGVMITMEVWRFQLDGGLHYLYWYFLGAAFCWALLSILSGYAQDTNPTVFSFYLYLMTVLIDAVFFLEPSTHLWALADGVFWFNFLTLTFASTTFATTVYFLGIGRLDSKRASAFTFLVPFFAIGLSVIFLSETWKWSALIGVSMTIFSLIVLNNIKITFYNRSS